MVANSVMRIVPRNCLLVGSFEHPLFKLGPKFQSPLLVTFSVVGVFGALLGRCCVAVHGGGDALLLVCRRAYDSQSASEHR